MTVLPSCNGRHYMTVLVRNCRVIELQLKENLTSFWLLHTLHNDFGSKPSCNGYFTQQFCSKPSCNCSHYTTVLARNRRIKFTIMRRLLLYFLIRRRCEPCVKLRYHSTGLHDGCLTAV